MAFILLFVRVFCFVWVFVLGGLWFGWELFSIAEYV